MIKKELQKSTYYYDLPERLIAQTPLEKRDNSRLLVVQKNGNKLSDKHFSDIIDYLHKGDVLVLNNTRVLSARLFGVKESTGAKIEVLLQKRVELNLWEVILKPAKRVSEGTKVVFSEGLYGVVKSKGDYGVATMLFVSDEVFEVALSRVGIVPLPPYIKQKLKDKERYQTVYSKVEGSSAAPTAGLHFTQELLQKIKEKGVEVIEVLLHVGLGTFRPVKEENILEHEMHSEYFEMSEQNAAALNRAKAEGRRIIAVGTTSVRVLESSVENGKFVKKAEETKIFIYPGYKFKAVDALITNFHLPESTLIMLVCAFAGYDTTMNAYHHAIEQEYRFFSFGDAMFIAD